MEKKEVLVGKFVKKNNILTYLEGIHNKYDVKYGNLFVYTVDGNKSEYLVTFKICSDKKVIKNDIVGSMILHYKKGCIFSINALNSLTGNENNETVDWSKYNGKLILMSNGNINVKIVTKIDDKTLFFN